MTRAASSIDFPSMWDSCSISLFKCDQKNSGINLGLNDGFISLISAFISWWMEHQTKAECIRARMIHTDDGNKLLSEATVQFLSIGSPNMCPVSVVSFLCKKSYLDHYRHHWTHVEPLLLSSSKVCESPPTFAPQVIQLPSDHGLPHFVWKNNNYIITIIYYIILTLPIK